jgi:hypothetical protein
MNEEDDYEKEYPAEKPINTLITGVAGTEMIQRF